VVLPGSTKEELLLAAVADFTSALDIFKSSVTLDPQYMADFLDKSQTATDNKLRQFTSMYHYGVVKQQIGGTNSSGDETNSSANGNKNDVNALNKAESSIKSPPPGLQSFQQQQQRNGDITFDVRESYFHHHTPESSADAVSKAPIITDINSSINSRKDNIAAAKSMDNGLSYSTAKPDINSSDWQFLASKRYNTRTKLERHLPSRFRDTFTTSMAYHINKVTHDGDTHFDNSMLAQQAVAYAVSVLNLDEHGQPLTYSKAVKGPNSEDWIRATADEYRKLFGTKTIKPIYRKDQPFERRKDTTYLNHVTAEKENPDGSIKRRVRSTAGGDRGHYPFDVSAKTADMEMVKVLVSGAASDRKRDRNKGKFATLDIKDYYLATKMDRPEYIRVKMKDIPNEIMEEFQLHMFVQDGQVLFQVDNCMYGYPQSGLLSQRRLFSHLENNGYHLDHNVPCLFRHEHRDVTFVLVVDDFAVKYSNKEDIDHLIATLQQQYEITINWSGSKYLGYTIEFDDLHHTVSLSMPNYVPKLLERFHPDKVIRGAASPAVYKAPKYGKKLPELIIEDESPMLSISEITTLQEIIGTLLFYARAVDYTILTAVSHVSSRQAKPTQEVMNDAFRILQYVASYPAHKLVFKACDMQLRGHSDASYLTRSNSRSVAGGIFYCSDVDSPHGYINGGLLAISTIIPTVVSSVAEAEYAALFLCGQHAI
jgi:hypothetical protein